MTIGPDRVEVLHVVDMAEIPAYAAILDLDHDGNGEIGADEGTAWAPTPAAMPDRRLTVAVDGQPVDLDRRRRRRS